MMLWCRACGAAMDEPLIAPETLIHDEVDSQRVEKSDIYLCPSCYSELDEADRCACGEWKDKSKDWCNQCFTIRDEEVQRCISRIRMEKKLALDTSQIKDLILTYFE